MTTVIGINGIDPSTNKSYVLILTDSRGTLPSEESHTDNDIKLFSPEASNYAFGTAGKCINGLFSSSSPSKGKLITKEGGIFEKSELEAILVGMNNQLQEDFGDVNNYLFGIQKNDSVDMCIYLNDELKEGSLFAASGSGSEYANEVLSPLSNYTLDGRICENKEEAIKIAVNAMKNAAKKDFGTGGHIDLAIMTADNIEIKRNYFNLNKDSEQRVIPLIDSYQTNMHPWQRDY